MEQAPDREEDTVGVMGRRVFSGSKQSKRKGLKIGAVKLSGACEGKPGNSSVSGGRPPGSPQRATFV